LWFIKTSLARKRSLACVPVCLFDTPQLYCQLVTTFGTTRLNDSTTIFGLHPLAEAMHAQAAADLGLPCSFGRHFLITSKNLNGLTATYKYNGGVLHNQPVLAWL
jgi:hypothetical protein